MNVSLLFANRLLQCSRLGIARNFRQYRITSQSTARTSLGSVCNVTHLNVQCQSSFCNTHSYKMEFHLRNLFFLIIWSIWLPYHAEQNPRYHLNANYSHLILQLKMAYLLKLKIDVFIFSEFHMFQ